MAEEPIRKDEILDFEGTKAAFNDLIQTVEKLSNVLHKDLKTSADELLKSLNGINIATKEGQEILNNAATATGTLVAQERELTKLDKEKITLQARLNALNTDTAVSNAQLKVQIERKNRELKEEKKLFDSAHGSVNDMRKKLKDLITEYNKLDASARGKVAPAINKLSSELKKAESAIGNNTRNVGNYRQAILDAGKQVIGFTSISAAATLVINKLKNAFQETEAGANFFNRIGQASKTFWQSLIGGENLQTAGVKSIAAFKIAKQVNDAIIGDRSDLVRIAELETEIAQLRYKSSDATLSETEQLNALNKAMAKEKELLDFKRADLQEDLRNVQLLLTTRTDDIALLNEEARIKAEIIKLDGDMNLRLLTKSSALREKMAKDSAKQDKDELTGLLAFMKATDEANSERMERRREEYEDVVSTYNKEQNALAEFMKITEDANADNRDRRKKDYEDELNAFLEKEDMKRMAVQDSLAAVGNSLNAFSSLFEAQKQRELSAVGDNAQKREEIERRYAKKQQALSIGQALINGAMAITEIWKKWAANPVLAGIFTALTAAQTTAQVAVIKSQKFARGGSGVLGGNVHASGGVYVPGIGEAERGEHFSIINRGATSKYGSGMLDAVANSINQGKFFEVWSNANRTMGAWDPYTKKMFDLMSKTPIVYIDSEGNTVKDFISIGEKQVIRKRVMKKKRFA